MSEKFLLSLGSNLGDRRAQLRAAVLALDSASGVSVTGLSPLYETEPWGKREQPDFLNLCLSGRTTLEPRQLLQLLKETEVRLGRQPTERWGPRRIDLDILFFEDRRLEEPGLTIPHPRLAERAFVLAPLADLAPGWQDPLSGKTVAELWQALDPAERRAVRRLPLPLLWGWRTYVMGILNVTPDSFSGDGLLQEEDALLEAALAQAEQFVADGVDILDVGGQSTRPGSTPVDAAEEAQRVVPVIEALRPRVNVPISIDTYWASVAEAALEAGADWINDVWALRMDPRMGAVAAAAGCPLVLMHNRSRPKDVAQEERLGGRYVGVAYDDLIGDVKRELQERVDEALAVGVAPENIILDPGIGFGKTVSQNLQLIDELGQFRALGYPLLIGPSRKSFIGYTLDLPADQRMEGTAATVAIGIDRGADIVRVHDVKEMVRVARMTDRIVRRHNG